ncbi:hypothetical protein RA19_00200 [Leisingera sp. ANG-M1]|uniref:hypothetical protein n=1 Tax=Leisingera sp. ANG-M1 TaxID=1577895 RepID=UPI0005806775|nr:hypothetical protein [Leisingera sp. ANG-M1]KIC12863.1 hypothetical protein RA19_00200 [Leisingera sp. ANG-M1]
MKIAYEKHPVSKERKVELRGQGFKIIDARFDPDRKDGVAEQEPQSREEIAKLPKPAVVKWLKARGVEKPEGSVAELRDQLAELMFPNA